jgi:hypothetical protein
MPGEDEGFPPEAGTPAVSVQAQPAGAHAGAHPGEPPGNDDNGKDDGDGMVG